ncbi:MAG: glycine cleavage system protein GcvH [Gammaproteobacteria bacterium]|nr:glycine cleavage system protein GcvH [Pseudomonadales bacterium]MCP5347567.1 glycine cleavage system protein GcvH [Pseudomonadales bacterium]
MSKFPDDLKYARSHEWVRVEDDGTVTVGISDHAQKALGDIVFVELPELETHVNARDEVAVVESVKAASDIYAPVSGKIIAINEKLVDAPETVNGDPYIEGWFFKIEMDDDSELEELLDADTYKEICDEE